MQHWSRVATQDYVLKASDRGRTKQEGDHEWREAEWCPQGSTQTDWDMEEKVGKRESFGVRSD